MKRAFLIASLTILSGLPVWAAFTPSHNGNNVHWVSASAESWSGSAQTRVSDGAVLHLAGAFDASVDTTNIGSTATAFIGLLDPIAQNAPDTPTPTETLTITFTFTPTPSLTPGGPTLTLTPTTCLAASLDSDFNFDGVNGIDSRDLLLLYAALQDGAGKPFDLDCSGTTDLLDLIRFSQKWQIEIP